MKKTIFILVAVVCISCINTLRGHYGVSNDLNDSKKRKVFIKELRPLANPYIINDTLKINVLSAWIEKKWYYGENLYEAIPLDEYQLIIESDESVDKVANSWQIGNSFVESFRSCGDRSIMIDIKELPKSDTLTWDVTLGRKYDNSRIIGKFILIAK